MLYSEKPSKFELKVAAVVEMGVREEDLLDAKLFGKRDPARHRSDGRKKQDPARSLAGFSIDIIQLGQHRHCL